MASKREMEIDISPPKANAKFSIVNGRETNNKGGL